MTLNVEKVLIKENTVEYPLSLILSVMDQYHNAKDWV